MPKDNQIWFRHDADCARDRKIIALEKKYGYAGSGLYWRVVEYLRSESDYKMKLDDLTYESLSKESLSPELVKEILDYCIRIDLFVLQDGYFWSERLIRDMDSMREKIQKQRDGGKLGASKRWGSKEDYIGDPEKYVKQKYDHIIKR